MVYLIRSETLHSATLAQRIDTRHDKVDKLTRTYMTWHNMHMT